MIKTARVASNPVIKHRFYISEQLAEGASFKCPKDLAHQLANVLRLKTGDEVTFFDGSGYDFRSRVEEIKKKECSLRIIDSFVPNREPKRKVILFQSLIKKEKFELVLQKGTEVGVSEFVPVIAERSAKRGFDLSRGQKIIKEAAEQAGRAFVPTLRDPMVFERAIDFTSHRGYQTFFASFEARPEERVAAYPSKYQVALFIGPEGGWTEREIEKARTAGYLVITLGKLTLRSETASIVAAYQLLH